MGYACTSVVDIVCHACFHIIYQEVASILYVLSLKFQTLSIIFCRRLSSSEQYQTRKYYLQKEREFQRCFNARTAGIRRRRAQELLVRPVSKTTAKTRRKQVCENDLNTDEDSAGSSSEDGEDKEEGSGHGESGGKSGTETGSSDGEGSEGTASADCEDEGSDAEENEVDSADEENYTEGEEVDASDEEDDGVGNEGSEGEGLQHSDGSGNDEASTSADTNES